MEDTLRAAGKELDCKECVLILVLMEDTLRDRWVFCKKDTN